MARNIVKLLLAGCTQLEIATQAPAVLLLVV